MSGRPMDLPLQEIEQRIREGWSLARVCEVFEVSGKTLWNRGIRALRWGGHNRGQGTPKPLTRCKRGHGRRVRDKHGRPCCPECRKASTKAWRARNPEAVKATQARFKAKAAR